MNDAPSQSPLPPHRGKFLWLWQWFWRVMLVASLGYTWYSFYVPSNNVAWATNYTVAQQQAAQSGKPIVLFFTGKWCVPCRIMKREVWADKQVTATVNAGFIPVTIDIDDPATVTNYHVSITPTTIITDPQGKVLQQVPGKMGKADFLTLLEKVKP